MFRTDNPIGDFARYDAAQQEWLDTRPICEICEEPIQTSKAFYYANQWFCKCKECEKELMQIIWEDIKEEYLVNVEE